MGADFARNLPFMSIAFHAYDDALGIDRIHHAGAFAEHDGAGIARGNILHAGSDIRSVGAKQRNGLALHVRSHERAVGVVVFEERNQARGHRDQLLGADVDVLDLFPLLQHEVAGLAGVAEIGDDASLSSSPTLAWAIDVLVFLPRREVFAVGFVLGGLLLGGEFGLAFSISARRTMSPDLVSGVAGIEDADFIGYHALDHLAVRAFDEAVFVDARKAGKRRDQPDVWAFRRFDRADASVVRGMDVADFESGALTGQTARSKGRETTFMGDLGERIRLIHELRKLAGSEEFADRRHYRLGVHQVVRHGRRHFLVDRHLFFDGALHADQADAELVLEQFAHRADAAVAEVIDVVHGADARRISAGSVEHVLPLMVARKSSRSSVRLSSDVASRPCRSSLMLNFMRPTREKSYLRGSKNMPWNSCVAVSRGGRIAGTQLAVDFDQRFVLRS